MTSETTTEPLSGLKAGEKGRVAGFDLAGDLKARLFEMGLTPGVELELIRFAPLGDPIEIKVRGYRLSLRKKEASGIRVSVVRGK